jgi:high-affinity nickel-transport protein
VSLLALLGLALVLGIRHAADPDHVVAVAAITARSRSLLAATRIAVLWGLGHSITLFAAGAVIVANLAVPPRVGLSLELAVAIALVTVGVWNLGGRPRPDRDASAASRGGLRAFAIGLVHGLAGSAAVALLVLATLRDPHAACGYLAVFAAGTLVGMVLVTASMAAPLGLAVRRWRRFGDGVRTATGALSLGMGAWLVYQIGWVDGLFLAAPRWLPH